MSEVGANPADVAAEALAAARAGRFLVLPDEWRAAAVRRTERLLSGDVPELPTPHAHPDARPPG
jgi:hypothetical protein